MSISNNKTNNSKQCISNSNKSDSKNQCLVSQINNLHNISSNLNINPPQYVEGDVYTVTYGEWGNWPMRIARTTEVSPATLKKIKKGQVLVYFFGSRDYGFITNSQIKTYNTKDLMSQKLSAADIKKMNKAIEEAKEWSDNAENKEYPVYVPETKKAKKTTNDRDYTPTKKKPAGRGGRRGRTAIKKEPQYQQNSEEIFDSVPDQQIQNDITPPSNKKRSPLAFIKDNSLGDINNSISKPPSTPQSQSIHFNQNTQPTITPLSHRRKQLEFPLSPFKPIIKKEKDILLDFNQIHADQIEIELMHLLGLYGPITLDDLKLKSYLLNDNQMNQHLEKISNYESTTSQWSLRNELYTLINETWHGYRTEFDRNLIIERKRQSNQNNDNSSNNDNISLDTTQKDIIYKPVSASKKPQPQIPSSPKKTKSVPTPMKETLEIITPIKSKSVLSFSSMTMQSYNHENNTSTDSHTSYYSSDLLNPAGADGDTTIPLLDDNSSSLPEYNDLDEEIECTQSNPGTNGSNGSSQPNGSNNTTTTTTINNIYFNNNFSNNPIPVSQATQITQTPPTPPSSHNNSIRITSTPYSSPGIPATLIVSPSSSHKKKSNYEVNSSQDDSDGDYIAPTIPINFGTPMETNNNNNNNNHHINQNTSTIIIDQAHLKEIVNDSEHLKAVIKDSITDLFSSHFKQHAFKDIRSVVEKELNNKLADMRESITEELQEQISKESKKRKKSIQTIIHTLSDLEQTICTLKQNLEKLVD